LFARTGQASSLKTSGDTALIVAITDRSETLPLICSTVCRPEPWRQGGDTLLIAAARAAIRCRQWLSAARLVVANRRANALIVAVQQRRSLVKLLLSAGPTDKPDLAAGYRRAITPSVTAVRANQSAIEA
jgi:hypothetical protein